MRIPKFWTRAVQDGFETPGWSFTSLAEATRVAQERVALLVEVLTGKRERQGRYLYGDRPVREPVVETIGNTDRPIALVTRNAYGALCLNTDDVVFVDVDLPDSRILDKLLAVVRPKDVSHPALDRIRAAHAAHPEWALRIYRTRAGFRVIALHARMLPNAPETRALFAELGADPLYQTLCTMQESFRARLTPKPWRIGISRMWVSFPWRDERAERAATAWASQYDEARGEFAVCQVIETLGTASGDPVIDQIVAFHDSWVLADGKQLA